MKHILAFAFLLLALTAEGRVISYAPYTDRLAVATHHSRTTRHFLINELQRNGSSGDLVLYDSAGTEEPLQVFGSTDGHVYWAAMWEDEREVPAILVAYYKAGTGSNVGVKFSSDGGRTFTETALPSTTSASVIQNYLDSGGPFTRGRFGPVRIGNKDYPFIVYDRAGAVWRVAANGVATRWVDAMANSGDALLGSDVTGTKFLIRKDASRFVLAGFDGTSRIDSLPLNYGYFSGWITPDQQVYLESSPSLGSTSQQPWRSLWLLGAPAPAGPIYLGNGFAVPTHDYSGAWIIDRVHGTRLSRHTPGKESVVAWVDLTWPEVEALHVGASGKTVLVQVHRPRPQAERIIIDPALAVWHVGDPAPTEYDELFLSEQVSKGFIHVDPDRVSNGEPFVFDSGITWVPPPCCLSSGGGGDIIQEWGVVRGSLKQQLVLPGVGRALGAFGSNWTTDVTLYNPAAIPQKVELRFAPTGAGTTASDAGDTKTVTLNAKEIRFLPDVLGTLFGRVGTGALFLTPEKTINATSRTYSRSARGTYGFGMGAIDLYAAASPRFPVSFSGAFPGPAFRTNVTLTDTTGHGAEATFLANGPGGITGLQNATFGVPGGGQQQINFMEWQLGIPGLESAALLVRPKRGFVIPSVFAIDNLTNDPTYFSPDLTSSVVRWIPVIGHLDGAYGSQFRTDIHLYNPDSGSRYLYLSAIPWDTYEPARTELIELKANESRVIRDAYATLFKKNGLARLRYTTSSGSSGTRVTSRTYTLDPNGGTYGCVTPPLNGFQVAVAGEALEILGVTGGAGYRTNLGIVEMNLSPANNQPPAVARIEIIDERGTRIDDFTVLVAIAGGYQINDIFRARGHGNGPASALIRVSPIRGQITTYATLTDNGTNDSTYLAPYLAAQP